MREEDNYTVWSNMASCLERIHNLLHNTDFDDLFSSYGLQIMKPIYNKLGCEIRPNEGKLHYSLFGRRFIILK